MAVKLCQVKKKKCQKGNAKKKKEGMITARQTTLGVLIGRWRKREKEVEIGEEGEEKRGKSINFD